MTRRDFQALAQALKRTKEMLASRDCDPLVAVHAVELAIIETCQKHNPRFNVAQFRSAAEPQARPAQ